MPSSMSDTERRVFVCDGDEWIAWASGGGSYGTGGCGLGNVEAIHFARAAERDQPLYEALIATGHLMSLFDEELLAVFRAARHVVAANELPEGSKRKPRTRSLQDHGPVPDGRKDSYE